MPYRTCWQQSTFLIVVSFMPFLRFGCSVVSVTFCLCVASVSLDEKQHDSVARYSRDFVKHIYLGHGVFTSSDTIEVAGKKLKFHKVLRVFGDVL